MRTSHLQELTGFGTVSGVPGLAAGFADIFNSYRIKLPDLALHAVIGGDGPPLLLLGGWPQTWYAWRMVMPALARHYTVIVIEARGFGRSDKPRDGYDSATVAADLVAAMDLLGHQRFAVVSHDIGMWAAYAMASDFPACVTRLAVIDATIPGISQSPPLIANRQLSDFLWHFNFNRALVINEQLVQGREDIYFGYQFATKAATATAIAPAAVAHYVDTLKDKEALRASFEYWRSLDQSMEQHITWRQKTLAIPVLAIGGAKAVGARVEQEMRSLADDVTGVVIPDCGHFVAEEAPHALLAALEPFLRA
ncbi:alpha/beta fold hydrolase [Janthinobacterium agaricidamnosum]|nr:alpha/beta hydrolase [Janthinobacterium agaricidamnosum]